MSIEEATRDTITRHVQEVAPPPVDVPSLVGRGRRRRTIRTAVGTLATLTVLGGAAGLGGWLMTDGSDSPTRDDLAPARTGNAQGPESINAPQRVFRTEDRVHLDGKSYPTERMSFGTGAHLVPQGITYPDERTGVPHLLRSDGSREALAPDQPTFGNEYGEWMASAPDSGLVAWSEIGDGKVELVAYDTGTGEEVARRRVPCEGPSGGQCPTPYVASDDVVFVHGPAGGTTAWQPATDRWTFLGAGEVSDARGHTVSLFPGSDDVDVSALGPEWELLELDSEHWREQEESGNVEALMSYDGAWVSDPWTFYVEDWRNPDRALRFKSPGEVVESQFDTDGSVLFVTMDMDTGEYRAWDCPVDAGCEPLTDPSRQEIRLLASDT